VRNERTIVALKSISSNRERERERERERAPMEGSLSRERGISVLRERIKSRSFARERACFVRKCDASRADPIAAPI